MEELGVQLAAGRLVRRLVEEAELDGTEAVEWLTEAFGWLNAAGLVVKGCAASGVGVLDVRQRLSEVAVRSTR